MPGTKLVFSESSTCSGSLSHGRGGMTSPPPSRMANFPISFEFIVFSIYLAISKTAAGHACLQHDVSVIFFSVIIRKKGFLGWLF